MRNLRNTLTVVLVVVLVFVVVVAVAVAVVLLVRVASRAGIRRRHPRVTSSPVRPAAVVDEERQGVRPALKHALVGRVEGSWRAGAASARKRHTVPVELHRHPIVTQ